METSQMVATLCIILACCLCSCSSGQLAQAQRQGPPLTAFQVDILNRIFPDAQPASAADAEPIHVPRGRKVAFQFALHSSSDALCKIRISNIKRKTDNYALPTSSKLYQILPVHVEANSQGCSRTYPYPKRPPADWMPYFVREAPFDVAEVLVENETIQLKAGQRHAVLAEVDVPSDAQPGSYTGRLEARIGDESVEAPFSFAVHPTVVSELLLHSVHWLNANPENLTNQTAPDWWSEKHWELLRQAGRQLRAFGDDFMRTPLIYGEHPLIQTIRGANDSYDFDFAKFDQWIQMFLDIGFKSFDGAHIANRATLSPLDEVYASDKADGQTVRIFDKRSKSSDWLEFVAVFYQALYSHLQQKGWTGIYVQHQMDEPPPDNLAIITSITNTHMPGIKTIDAIHAWKKDPYDFSPYVDIYVFYVDLLSKNQKLAKQRQAQGLTNWFYRFCKPYPPRPNCWLDKPLTETRLYPWLAYLYNAEGFLFWAANNYRGADPYRTSIGPVPGGSQSPGHPPGDNWMFYPGPQGLRPSMRMVAFRDGLLDYTLLKKLSEKNRQKADEIMNQMARSIVDYARAPVEYHQARKQLLEALDNL